MKRFCLLLPLLLGAAGPPRVHADADAVATALGTARREIAAASTWRSPTDPERRALAGAVVRLARALDRCDAATLASIEPDLRAGGYALTEHRVGTERLLVLSEIEPHGGGLVALRCGEALPLLVQAPHAFHDLGTGALVDGAFARVPVRAAMWNTVHRYRALPGERPEDPVHPADVCHQPGSLFQTVTLALAAARPELRVVQVHGYGGEPTHVDLVASTGRADRPPRVLREVLASTLGVAPSRVGVYPDDVDVLGGTTNVAARRLAADAPRFLHLELSRDLREVLRAAPGRLDALLRRLAEVPWVP